MTIPGAGGQVPPRPDQQTQPAQPVPVSPGSNVIVARRVIIIGTGGELLVYTPTQGAGNLIDSVAGAAFTDQFSNHGLEGTATYGPNFAASLIAGAIQFYTGSLAAGWTPSATVETDSLGDLILLAKTGRPVSTNNNTLDDGSGNMTVVGTLSVNGSTSTGPGDNGGVTSGPSGTVNAFPAAGPNHTHAETHHHPL